MDAAYLADTLHFRVHYWTLETKCVPPWVSDPNWQFDGSNLLPQVHDAADTSARSRNTSRRRKRYQDNRLGHQMLDEFGAELKEQFDKQGRIITPSVAARASGKKTDSSRGRGRGRPSKRSANNPRSGNTSGNTSAGEDQPSKRPRTQSTGRNAGSNPGKGKGQKKDQKKFTSNKRQEGKAYSDAADPTGAHRKEAVVTHKSPLVPPTGAKEQSYHDTRQQRHKADRAKQLALFKEMLSPSTSTSEKTETLKVFALTPTQAKLDQRPLDLPGHAREHQPHTIETVDVQVNPAAGALPPEGDGQVKPKKPKKPKKAKKDKDPANKGPEEEIPMDTGEQEPENLGQQTKDVQKEPEQEAIGAAAGGGVVKQAPKQQKQKERKDPNAPPSLYLGRFPM